ncbi:MAG: DsbA family oxidoreductase [Anaerolineales bacterium]|nr:DsbA family oxidoreductase [Anaerolineales bacterium]
MQRSLQDWQGEEITVEYKAFFLDPSIPPEGVDFRKKMNSKGGGRIPIEQFFDGPRQMGESVGLKFNFEAITKAPNTTLSHALIALTPNEKVDSVIDDVYAAYFEHGQDIGDIEVLLKVAEKNGMDAPSLKVHMMDAETRFKVQAEVDEAYQLGVSGVPFFVVNHKYAFSGAQPPQVITQILQKVEKEMK